ncbi:hypothetical protein N7462_004704 [Penicillium macrosclerotiorum]|uniref:uncharacterized protein n=1 Tax=Penicillium macrosclerotiorum TaxID=303699 RepID=UPI0025478CA6|nr:uncharacterized protein N7462_004704 [Penicillium macrosclerotiorum]KAJ5690312.1 hypothetical protein N7462_004704 [Penicillium macrosclerotiorum]
MKLAAEETLLTAPGFRGSLYSFSLQLPSSMEEAQPPRVRRATKACAFCRRRKLRCNNEKPTCSNCKGYGKECFYTIGPERSRYDTIYSLPLTYSRRQGPPKPESLGWKRKINFFVNGLEALNVNQLPQVFRHPERNVTNAKKRHRIHPLQHPIDLPAVRGNGLKWILPSQLSLAYTSLPMEIPAIMVLQVHCLTMRRQTGGPRYGQMIHDFLPIMFQSSSWVKQPTKMESINLQQGKLDFDGVDPDLGMHLLSLHWNRQHHSFLVTHRPAFMRDMAVNGPYFSKLLLNAIFFGASKFSNRPEVRRDPDDVRTAGWTFRMRVKELLGSALDRSEITTIQALLVMTSSLFALGDERSAAWLYAGTAFRMIIDLGMHVDATMLTNMRRLSDEDLEIRRRVFWGAFVVDKIQSLYQGRPASLQDFDTKVSLSFLDTYEEFEHWQPFAYSDVQSYPGSPAYSVSTFTELCKLSLVLNGILNKVYSERSSTRSRHDLIATLNSLDTQLESWHSELPSHLRFTSSSTRTTPPPHVLSLLALYNVLRILLHRPFVAEGHLYATDPSVAITSFNTCTAAATRIIRLLQAYDSTYSIRHAPYLISYATYVAATIFVRVAAQREGGSRAHASLRVCLDVFKKNQSTNWAVRRAENVILHLMDRMGVDLGHQMEHNTSQQAPGITRDTKIDSGLPNPSDGDIFHSMALDNQESPPQGELESSELDIDMIIQSFIRQTDRTVDGQTFAENVGHTLPDSTAVTLGLQPASSSAMIPVYDYGSPDTRFDVDMLFGFNGSLQDDIAY